MIQQSIFSETAKQQQQTTSAKVQQRIVSPLSSMNNIGMNKDKPSNLTQQHGTPTQKPVHSSGVKQLKMKIERELKKLKLNQQIQQQDNRDLNIKDAAIPDIQGTV
ncbi:MAG: hypothetical protein EZS28_012892 [Streblomastix strix]|uniref:Uncharacterized protein n=1 Tax=Streblomastix strix TaxID=222440 RepID=A0A5J4W9H8_9EUKA|nr:MAG: hypothetical protein EZS28_012892 [Streblomastix strix]